MTRPNWERTLTGLAGSPGIAIGTAYVERPVNVDPAPRDTAPEEVENEVARFRAALKLATEQLEAIRDRVSGLDVQEPRLILDTHILMLQDEMLIDDTVEGIRRDKVNAEWALRNTMIKIRSAFAAIGDEYFRERVADVDQVVARIQRNLAGHQDGAPLGQRAQGHVIVHHDLTPADTAQLKRGMVLGFATDTGGKTSHTVIMARSLEIPAVVGLGRATAEIDENATLILDGYSGLVIVDPSETTLKEYQQRKALFEERERRLRANAAQPAQTSDGQRILLQANLELPAEVELAKACGADGIGMFRTEFLFMNRRDLPGEQEQYLAYRGVVEAMDGRPCTIRTLDLGGDKLFSPADRSTEPNPALGLRAIRFCLKDLNLFRQQLRAILRASAHGKVRILLPLISGLEELRRARQLIERAKSELKNDGIAYDDKIEIGVMIEVPSAAMIADLLAKEVDYFSIGTNDLIQYVLAIDRGNEDVAYLYEPLHPSLLRLLKLVIDAGRAAGRRVNICGEMGGEPQYLLVLLGLGLTELSMHAVQIPRLKRWVNALGVGVARTVAEKALTLSTAAEVRQCVADAMRQFESPTGAE
jgi:phosphotransferase system enzyme I (PtsI)